MVCASAVLYVITERKIASKEFLYIVLYHSNKKISIKCKIPIMFYLSFIGFRFAVRIRRLWWIIVKGHDIIQSISYLFANNLIEIKLINIKRYQ